MQNIAALAPAAIALEYSKPVSTREVEALKLLFDACAGKPLVPSVAADVVRSFVPQAAAQMCVCVFCSQSTIRER